MELTAGQERNARARIERKKFLAECERIIGDGRKPNIPAMAARYKRTTQCLYQWRKWGEAQNGVVA